jgi:CII-binding regulator of phage lambda lysogenization HflD
MSEQELRNFIVVYQQKLNEMLTQNVALEAKLMSSNQIIELLNKKVAELQEQEQPKRTSKKTEDFA